MSKKYLGPLPKELPPVRPELEAEQDDIYEKYVAMFEERWNTPEFERLIKLLGPNPGATGDFWIDRYFAAKMVEERARQDGLTQVTDLPIWEIAAMTEASLHRHGLSSDARQADAPYLQ